MVLAVDVGGTKTLVALFDARGGALALARLETYPSREHGSLEEILARFLAGGARPTHAGFGVAGPVIGGKARITNLPWVIDAAALASALGLPRVALVNDLEANAWAVLRLGPGDLALLKPGQAAPDGSVAVVSAGTGLGEGALLRFGGRAFALASEGGHADFAARGELEIALLRHLAAEFGHVSYERILSGPGLFNVYRFLRDTGRGEEPAWLAREIADGDPSAAVARAAAAGRSALCELALQTFLGVYGAEAGNAALRVVATGGVYLGGGIAPKLLGLFRDAEPARAARFLGAFHDGFVDKGRFRPMVEALPVQVIMNDRAALLGAAHAALLAEDG